GKFRGRTVKRLDDQLRIHSHFMHGAIRPIDELFGMIHGPAFVITGGVARVGAGRRIAAVEGRFKRLVTNLADETAIADGFEFSVPVRSCRKPHFKADMRIARGRRECDHAAKSAGDMNITPWSYRPSGNWNHQIRRWIDCCGGGDCCVGNLKRCQAVARLLCRGLFRYNYKHRQTNEKGKECEPTPHADASVNYRARKSLRVTYTPRRACAQEFWLKLFGADDRPVSAPFAILRQLSRVPRRDNHTFRAHRPLAEWMTSKDTIHDAALHRCGASDEERAASGCLLRRKYHRPPDLHCAVAAQPAPWCCAQEWHLGNPARLSRFAIRFGWSYRNRCYLIHGNKPRRCGDLPEHASSRTDSVASPAQTVCHLVTRSTRRARSVRFLQVTSRREPCRLPNIPWPSMEWDSTAPNRL